MLTRNTRTLILGVLLSAVYIACGARVCTAKQLVGLWNAHGRQILPIEYDEIRRIGDKFVVSKSVTNDNGVTTRTQFEIDKTGKRLTQPHPVPPAKPYQATTETKFPVPPGWMAARNYDFGCSISKDQGRTLGFVDIEGKLSVLPKDRSIIPVGAGLFMESSYPDVGGEIFSLLGPDFKKIATLPREIQILKDEYRDGLLKVRTANGAIGFINTSGVYQIKPLHIFEADDFRNGICNVEIKTRDGNAAAVIDRNGKVLAGPYANATFPFAFRNTEQIVVDFAAQKRGGVIDRNGRPIISLDHDFILEYGDKYVGRKDGHWKIFSHDGKVIQTLPESVSYLSPAGKGLWVFAEGGTNSRTANEFRGNPNQDSKYGIMGDSGNVVVPAKFSATSGEISDGLLLVQTQTPPGDRWGVLHLSSKTVSFVPGADAISLEGGFVFAYRECHKFDGEIWKNSLGGNWQDFLFTYDLIGMPREKVEALLGKPAGPLTRVESGASISQYSRGRTAGCGNSYRGVQIEFDSKEFATGWRDVTLRDVGEWHRDNVLLINAPHSQSLLVVPKYQAGTIRRKN
ncbi:WG repeat-containing protein [Candidatus Obscuribacterales bacterium]|nr:WG repeat-containing protein [Candidatus Obscuribacterales bacterium]